MNQLWEWTATDRFGRSRKYQAYSPSETQAQMLEHLQGAFPHLKLTGLERVPDSAYKPPTGPVQSHAFEHGYYRDAMVELGHQAPTFTARHKLIARRSILPGHSPILRASSPIVRASIIPR